MTVNTLTRHLPKILILGGLGATIVAVLGDVIGIGNQPGLGARQLSLMVYGSLSLFVGIFFAMPLGTRYRQALLSADIPQTDPLLISVWFGLITGWTEAVTWGLRRFIFGKPISMSVDFLWLVPLASLVLFLSLGIILSFLNWLWPKFISTRATIFINAFVAFLSILVLWFPGIHKAAVILLAIGLALKTGRIIAIHLLGFHWILRRTAGRLVAELRSVDIWRVKRSTQDAKSAGLHLDRKEFLFGAGSTVASMFLGVRGWQRFEEQLATAKLSSPTGNMPNVLLIVLDTVRAESLSLYGYHRPTTPELERLAKKGVLFERALATAPWTLPSHASIFTGHYPHNLTTGWWAALDGTHPTLAEHFQSYGYMTSGFVANILYCSREFGLARGFVHYEDHPVSPGGLALSSSLGRYLAMMSVERKAYLVRKSAEHINKAFLHWLSKNGRGQPFFAFLNYFDAHDPFVPPEEFARKVISDKSQQHLLLEKPRLHWVLEDQLSLEELQLFNDAYDASIAYLDHQIGQLLEELDAQGVLENTLVIITSDHGEHFGEHGLESHGTSLYMPLLHVPLLVLFPSRIPSGRRVQQAATLRSLPATILDITGVGRPRDFPGESLVRFWSESPDTTKTNPEILLAEVQRRADFPDRYPVARGSMQSLYFEGMHYIRNEGSGQEELYDTEADPAEDLDLAGSVKVHAILERFRSYLRPPNDN